MALFFLSVSLMSNVLTRHVFTNENICYGIGRPFCIVKLLSLI